MSCQTAVLDQKNYVAKCSRFSKRVHRMQYGLSLSRKPPAYAWAFFRFHRRVELQFLNLFVTLVSLSLVAKL